MVSRSLRKVLIRTGLLAVAISLVVAAGMALASDALAADEENCQVCHRYSGLGTIDKRDGTERVFYVNEELFKMSVHGKVRCGSCHFDVKEIPHRPAKKVDCATKCHVKEPSTGKEFSHEVVVKAFVESSHGKDIRPGFEKDKPNCVYCHQNPIYSPIRDILTAKKGIELAILMRCRACHEDKVWTDRFYRHFTHRMHLRLTHKEVVELCASCHEDAEKMRRYALEPTWSLKDSFHWEAVKYEAANAPNCVTCHAPPIEGGQYTVHTITKLATETSPLFTEERRLKVCAMPDCHPAATATFAKGKVHAAGIKVGILREQAEAEVLAGEPTLTEEERAILIERAQAEQLKFKIVRLVKIFYTVLIGVICGGMFIHQVLDFIATMRERREGKH